MGKTITFRGGAANNIVASLLVDNNGEQALEKCTGPIRAAVKSELERRKQKQSDSSEEVR